MNKSRRNFIKKYKNQINGSEERIRNDPSDKFAYVDLAIAYWHLNKFRSAQRYAEIAFDMDPSLSDPYWILATIKMLNNEPKEIFFPLAEKAYKLGPGMIEATICYAIALIETKRVYEGVALLENAVEIEPYNFWAHSNLLVGYGKLEEKTKYNEEVRILAKIHPTFITISRRYWLFLQSTIIGKWLINIFIFLSIISTVLAIILNSPLLLGFAFLFFLHIIHKAILLLKSGYRQLGRKGLVLGIFWEIIVLSLIIWLL
jgi:tetratricopeptide (TPR) repeat protein